MCFITLEDETGIANLVVWPDRFAAQRSVVMGARLMAVHGVVQHDEAVVHIIASRLEDDTHMLRQLSDTALPNITSRGDGGGAMAPHPEHSGLRPPRPMVHPRNVQCLPKSRDFH